MLLYFTDAMNNNSVAVNPKHVVAVFIGVNSPDIEGKTIINTVTGTLIVNEELMEAVGRINGELKND